MTPEPARVTFYLDPDPLTVEGMTYLPEPDTDDDPYRSHEPSADRRRWALGVLIVAFVVVAIVWWPRP